MRSPAGNQDPVLSCALSRPLACCRVAPTVALSGYTTQTYNGNLGGYVGANAKCRVQFPGSFFCTDPDYFEARSAVAPPAGGAWVDDARVLNGVLRAGGAGSTANSCRTVNTQRTWTSTAPTGVGPGGGRYLDPTALFNYAGCSGLHSLACCIAR
ncbi:MAG: hypothetical protein Q8L14_30705 [Myxococcales bacterium]|nr:hypothetical protein [Myxococcales bacterium]